MVAVIAAVAKNGVIGSGNKIPWDIPADKKYFKKLTSGNILVIGRKTFESIGFALPGRTTIVVSTSLSLAEENLISASSFENAFCLAKKISECTVSSGVTGKSRDIFFAGGAEIYRHAMEASMCEKIFLTEIDAYFAGNVFFPSFDKSVYCRRVTAHFAATQTTPAFDFVEYKCASEKTI